MRRIVDPRLAQGLQSAYPSVCVIHHTTFTESGSGQKVETLGGVVVGMSHIHCRIGPLILIRPTDNEIRTARILSNYEARQIDLSGYFPGILVRLMRAIVDGREYPIRGVEHDGSHHKTRLRLEIVNP